MAEELSKYLKKLNIRCQYIHSEVETMERVEIIRDLRLGDFDVLVGVNLLREGLDLPEVSLVAIMDADKEGFLRNERSLTQTAGRAARNVNGMVIFYAPRSARSRGNHAARRLFLHLLRPCVAPFCGHRPLRLNQVNVPARAFFAALLAAVAQLQLDAKVLPLGKPLETGILAEHPAGLAVET